LFVYLTCRRRFAASHRLFNPALSPEENEGIFGLCNNPNGHGHNYLVDVTLRGIPDPRTGFLWGTTDGLKAELDRILTRHLDHKNLNLDVDFLQGVVPTAENIARRIYEVLEPDLAQLHAVTVHESPNNIVTYGGAEPTVLQ